MPAPPKLAWVVREIWLSEIHRQFDAEQAPRDLSPLSGWKLAEGKKISVERVRHMQVLRESFHGILSPLEGCVLFWRSVLDGGLSVPCRTKKTALEPVQVGFDKALVLSVSAATIDRSLNDAKVAAAGGRRRRAGFDSAIRRDVPMHTFDAWNDPIPGLCEVDMVAPGGTSVAGSFNQTLTMVDVATGWTERLPTVFSSSRPPSGSPPLEPASLLG
jgi:hypothetical protein